MLSSSERFWEENWAILRRTWRNIDERKFYRQKVRKQCLEPWRDSFPVPLANIPVAPVEAALHPVDAIVVVDDEEDEAVWKSISRLIDFGVC
jgi:hypothetical protein